MRVVMDAAEPEIQQVGNNDKGNGRYQKPVFKFNKELFECKKDNAICKQKQGKKTMMMLPVSMVQRKRPDRKSQQDHTYFKSGIVYDINAEKGKTGQE